MAVTANGPGKLARLSIDLSTSQHVWLLVVVWLLVTLAATRLVSPHIPGAVLGTYALQPLLWISLSVLVLRLWRGAGSDTMRVDAGLVASVALLALCQIVLFTLAGFLTNFGKSPLAHSMPVVFLNLWLVATRLAGFELTRWFIVVTLGKRRKWLGVAVAWLVLWLAAAPLSSFSHLGGGLQGLASGARYLLPGAAESLLATYLVMVGGPWPAIAYRGLLQGFEWLAPILPDLPLPLAVFLGVAAPLLALFFTHDVIEPRLARKADAAIPGEAWGMKWVAAALFAVFIFWFNTGLFGVRPALIVSPSMVPALNIGDIVISRTASAKEIKINDVIRYKSGSISIMHRVVDIKVSQGRRTFITMGDNNEVEDAPVDQSKIEGKLVYIVPRLGWLAIGLRNAIFGSG
jgi:signal peptidase I